MSERSAAQPPLPPPELMTFVGHQPDENLEVGYLVFGEILKRNVIELLGPDWSWEGRRLLDFGCGSGRLLRQFLNEAMVGEFHGSEISQELAGWTRAHLCPPIAAIEVNGPRPPLPYPDGHFDVVTAMSVFTHIANGWSDWLLELRRITKPDGRLIATFIDAGCKSALPALSADAEGAGMSVYGFGSRDVDLPNVVHSHWWLQEHWGRAFELLELRPGTDGDVFGEIGQGLVALRPRDVDLTPSDLERERPGDDRYLTARRYQYELLRAEGDDLRRDHAQLAGSLSWRLTAPLRRGKAAVRRAQSRLRRRRAR